MEIQAFTDMGMIKLLHYAASYMHSWVGTLILILRLQLKTFPLIIIANA